MEALSKHALWPELSHQGLKPGHGEGRGEGREGGKKLLRASEPDQIGSEEPTLRAKSLLRDAPGSEFQKQLQWVPQGKRRKLDFQ